MVDHDDVGLRRAPARPEQEAAVEVRALEPGAEIGLGAHLVPDLRARRDRQIAQRAVGRVARPLGDADQLVELVLLEQGALGRHRLVHPGEAEIVPPSLEQREGRLVVVLLERPPQQRQVLADELLLQVDRVGADDRALAVGPRPGQRGDEIGERLPDPGPRLEQQHAAVVVPVGDVGRHVALARPILVLPQLRGDRPALAQRVDDVERIDRDHRPVAGHLDDDVELGRAVVDDAEPHAGVVEAGRHVQVGAGGIEPATGMVVQEHLPALHRARAREHHVHRAPREHARRGDDPVPSTSATNDTSRPPAAAISAAR